jgi:plastocyanin
MNSMPNTSRPNSNKAAAVSLICRQTLSALILVLTAGMARADIIQVKMEKLGFVLAEVTAHVGDTIEWVNADFVAHTATARNGAWDVLIPVNAKRNVVLKDEGMVDYYCKFHPNMTGKILISK